MFGMTTDESQPKEVFSEVEKLINLDGTKTPTTPSESESKTPDSIRSVVN